MHARIRFAALAVVFLSGSLMADQVVMKNGDVITGTITKLSGGKVTIDPSYADAFTVDVSEIASMTAEKVFEIEMDDGSQFSGQIVLDDGDQALLVDGATRPVMLAEVVSAGDPEPYYERVSHVDLNLTKNTGNTDSSNTLLFADTRMRFGVHRHLAELVFARDKTNGVRTKEQDLFRYDYNWMLDGPWFLGANASFERDPIKNLEYRYVVGALVGRDWIQNDRQFLSTSAGIGYSREEIGDMKEDGAVATWRMIYEHSFLDGKLAFFHNNSINYQMFGNNNTIFKTNTGFRYDIIANIYANISYRYDYETEPAPGASKDDSTLVFGVGAEF